MRVKRAAFQFLLFIFLLVLVEFCLRVIGYKPGLLTNDIHPVDTLVYEQRFKADSLGMMTYIKDGPFLPEGYVINEQGFRSNFNYDRATIDSLSQHGRRKVVFMIGDSYTDGCCASKVENSFVDLVARDTSLLILNFGVAATGLQNYLLILREYYDALDPDLVIINFYAGNDVEMVKKVVAPYVPEVYIFRDMRWLNANAPPYFEGHVDTIFLSTPEMAYDFYIDNYTLWGKDVGAIGKLFRNSVFASKLYLGVREKCYLASWMLKHYRRDMDAELTNSLLSDVMAFCESRDMHLIISCIPAPMDVKDGVDMEEKYDPCFDGIEHVYAAADLFSVSDYDGLSHANHFNDSGHAKYADFLEGLIREELTD